MTVNRKAIADDAGEIVRHSPAERARDSRVMVSFDERADTYEDQVEQSITVDVGDHQLLIAALSCSRLGEPA